MSKFVLLKLFIYNVVAQIGVAHKCNSKPIKHLPLPKDHHGVAQIRAIEQKCMCWSITQLSNFIMTESIPF